ncbi:MAG: (2Fe-2S) ferredoxin domain-containing protein [Alphaproteobacteria bacterium]|nr:(2Fe-2S) ferredoxin domain-containing protein [Alphaproteobacteria bacterium]
MYYKSHVFCCTNERPPGHERGCCKDKNAADLRNYMKARVKELGIQDTRVNGAGCLDRCEQGPAIVIYPEGTWYRPKTRADIDDIITTHITGGKTVDRLLMKDD